MSTMTKAEVRELSRRDCDAILARNYVGRLAYARGNQIDVEPIHYVYGDGWIYGRTSPGRKADLIGESWCPVAFEVDEVEALFSWRSVVVHGGLYVLDANGPEWEQTARRAAVEHLRRLMPKALLPGDPAPQRTLIFRIAVQEITGREAVPASRLAS